MDLAKALASLAGCKEVAATSQSERLAELVGPAEHLLFALVDGMGEQALGEACPHGFLARYRAESLRAVFPSTTAAALTSLATAEWPSRHAVCGWWMHLDGPGLSITTLPFIDRHSERPLSSFGLRAPDVFPLTSVWARTCRPSATLLKRGLEDGAFAHYMTGEKPRLGYRSMEEAFSLALERVEKTEGPSFTYLYLPHFDASCHEAGIDASLPVLQEIDRRLSHLTEALEGKARVVVSADHGMVDLSPERIVI
ncbi:MAG: alkaline phosphatase family protein, partial [Myxococcota bacterium]